MESPLRTARLRRAEDCSRRPVGDVLRVETGNKHMALRTAKRLQISLDKSAAASIACRNL
jgi:hypothetical protein